MKPFTTLKSYPQKVMALCEINIYIDFSDFPQKERPAMINLNIYTSLSILLGLHIFFKKHELLSSNIFKPKSFPEWDIAQPLNLCGVKCNV